MRSNFKFHSQINQSKLTPAECTLPDQTQDEQQNQNVDVEHDSELTKQKFYIIFLSQPEVKASKNE